MSPRLALRADAKAAQRAFKFFTTQINDDHTRKFYLNATRRFSEWHELQRLH